MEKALELEFRIVFSQSQGIRFFFISPVYAPALQLLLILAVGVAVHNFSYGMAATSLTKMGIAAPAGQRQQ